MNGQAAGAAWEKQVLEVAGLLRWRVASFRSVRVQRKGGGTYYATPVEAGGKGFPDLVLVRGERLLFRELKTDRARLSREQKEWIATLEAAGADVGVWRPRDLDRILEELR